MILVQVSTPYLQSIDTWYSKVNIIAIVTAFVTRSSKGANMISVDIAFAAQASREKWEVSLVLVSQGSIPPSSMQGEIFVHRATPSSLLSQLRYSSR